MCDNYLIIFLNKFWDDLIKSSDVLMAAFVTLFQYTKSVILTEKHFIQIFFLKKP